VKSHKPFMVLPICLTLIQCGGPLGPINELPRQLSQSEMMVIEANTEFALNLLREINAQDTTGGNSSAERYCSSEPC